MDLTSWLVDGLTVSDLLKFSTEWRDMGQSYRFCAGYATTAIRLIRPLSLPHDLVPADLNSSKCPKL